MPEPGEYRADVTEGITRVEDLPKPKFARAAATPKGASALVAAQEPLDCGVSNVSYTTSVTWCPGTPTICTSPMLSITVPAAAIIATPIRLTWPFPGAMTRTES